jgi:heme A synthase
MDHGKRRSAFSKFAWAALAYNLVVILWGVFLRASHSGDGCGQHWLTCQGEVVPSAPELKTIIEYSHRITTAIAGLVVLALVIWAVRRFGLRHRITIGSLGTLFFIIVEALIGRGLVLTGNTAGNWTPTRPYWTAGHLINTFLLLACLALTAWFASTDRMASFRLPARIWLLLAIGVAGILFVGVSGSMAALTNMLFPSASLSEGLAKDFDASSHYLLRLRISHPLLSGLSGVYLIFLAGWLRKWWPLDMMVLRWSNALTILVLFQLVFGAATLLMLAPIVMQVGHLFLADAVWISFVLLSASIVSSPTVREGAAS